MSKFKTYTVETAVPDALPIFQAAHSKWGMVANILGKMAEAPALLKGYWELSAIFEKTSLTPAEQQVVLITASVVNNCDYCVGAHSAMADMIGVPTTITDAIRNQFAITDSRFESLHNITREIVQKRGWISDKTVTAFFNAGYTRAQLLEVILGVGFKTLSNYANHIMETELDSAFSNRSWSEKN